MKTTKTSVFFYVSQPPGQATIKQEPVADNAFSKRRQLLYDKYSHRRQYWERKRCPIAGLMRRADKRRKIKFKSGELVMLKSMMSLPFNYKDVKPYMVLEEASGNCFMYRAASMTVHC